MRCSSSITSLFSVTEIIASTTLSSYEIDEVSKIGKIEGTLLNIVLILSDPPDFKFEESVKLILQFIGVPVRLLTSA